MLERDDLRPGGEQRVLGERRLSWPGVLRHQHVRRAGLLRGQLHMTPTRGRGSVRVMAPLPLPALRPPPFRMAVVALSTCLWMASCAPDPGEVFSRNLSS